MQQRVIRCAFCRGTGHHPHYKATCPVCKGTGENRIVGEYMACADCHGSGRKSGTTLTCYTCSGLGVVPDIRKDLQKAREEIRRIQEEMEEERVR
jgi:DnaJ-class molecular chaperone